MYKLGEIDLSKLPPTRARSILEGACRTKIVGWLDDMEINPGEALVLWVADWLASRRPVDDDAQMLILTRYASDIEKVSAIVEHSLAAGEMPTLQLVIIDATLAGMTGHNDIIDLRSGETHEGPKQMPIEVTSLNLTALYIMHRTRMEKKRDRNQQGS